MRTLIRPRFANGDLSFALFAAFVLVASVLMAVLGPFGTMLTMEPPQRFAHWIVSGCAIGLINALAMIIVRTVRGGRPTPIWMIAVIAAVAALPGAFIIEACLRVWSPDALRHVGIGTLFLQCLLLNEVLTLLAIALFRTRTAAGPVTPKDANGARALLDRLPRPFRDAELLAIAAEDHYLRVHTDRGETLIHMRMADAEALLRNADGLRVHRSHWVAHSALASVKRHNGQVRLVLRGGIEAPVARSRHEALKAAGWFSDHG